MRLALPDQVSGHRGTPRRLISVPVPPSMMTTSPASNLDCSKSAGFITSPAELGWLPGDPIPAFPFVGGRNNPLSLHKGEIERGSIRSRRFHVDVVQARGPPPQIRNSLWALSPEIWAIWLAGKPVSSSICIGA